MIDSGIDFTHPDLANNQWLNPAPSAKGDLHGWDFVDDNAEINDEQGHGTAVAGIIAAEGNNSLGITGVMWRASLMSLRVLDNTGTGDVANAVQAIDYAITHGAQVINLSWGTPAESVALREAIERAIRRNVVVVCSAGNNGQNIDQNPYYPASFDLKDLIAVAASDNYDQPASWSNWGARTVTVAAPGTNILTTQRGGGYWNVTGTSAAAPIVSGIAGLLKTFRPMANTAMIARAISAGARQTISEAEYDHDYRYFPENGPFRFVSAFGGMTWLGWFPQDPVPQPHPTPTPRPSKPSNFSRCFNGWRFSATVDYFTQGSRLNGAARITAQVLEIGPPVSLAGDAGATALKATRSGIGGTTNPYASGLTFFFRHTADASVKGSLIKFGTKATPILSGIGAFTGGFNFAMAVQCGLGVIE